MKTIKTTLTITIISILLFTNNTVKAIVQVEGNWDSLGKNNICKGYGGYIACYEPKFEFRVTLVKNTGQKVEGTKSIEYGYSNDGVTRKIDFTQAQKNNFVNPNSFKYKYSDEFNDYNPISSHTYYQVNMVNNPNNYILASTGKDNPDKYKDFTDAFVGSINARTEKYGIENGKKGTFDFLTMFLYHCGYLDKNQSGGQYYSIHDATNEYVKNKKIEISNNDYYMLIEPLYTIFYNETESGKLIYKYGTASEIGQLLYDKTANESKMQKGYMAGLSLIFTYNAGSNLYTQPNEFTEDFRTTKPLQIIDINDLKKYNTNNPTKPLDVRYNRRNKWGELANTNYGYGVSILRLKTGLTEVPQQVPINTTLNQCGTEIMPQANDGVISFKTSFIDNLAIDNKIFEYEENKLEKDSTDNSTVYCYDEFTYDFSQTLKGLNSNENNSFKPSTKVEIKPGKLTVNRYCYIKDWDKYEKTSQKISFVEKFSMYTSKKIFLNLFGNTLELEPTELNLEQYNGLDYEYIIKPSQHPLIPNKYIGIAIIKMTAEVEYKYQEVEYKYQNASSKFTIPSTITANHDYQSSIDLSNISYGYSTKIINELQKNNINYEKLLNKGKDVPTTYNITLNYEDTVGNENDKICSVISKTADTPGGGGKTPPPPGPESQIKFRTISLSNPFPARDASSRMPGSNWLGKENYVRGYITYNRGVTAEEVYQKEPIYVIDLTPSTMIKIREYNKKYNYDDIELNCTGENNTECFSEFLRNSEIFDSNIEGTCMISKSTYNDITNGITAEQLQEKLYYIDNTQNLNEGTNSFTQKTTYDSRYDFNNDKRVNKNDAAIYTHAEKTTSYYTCADKTYENSGYLGRGEE